MKNRFTLELLAFQGLFQVCCEIDEICIPDIKEFPNVNRNFPATKQLPQTELHLYI